MKIAAFDLKNYSRHIVAALDLPEIEEIEPLYDSLQEEADDEPVI